MNYRHSSTGPDNGYWQYQLNGGAWTLIGDFSDEFSSTGSSGAAITPISLTGISALQSLAAGAVVNFRVVPYGATGSSGTWYVFDGGNNTGDLVVSASASGSFRTGIGGPGGARGVTYLAADPVVAPDPTFFDAVVPAGPKKRPNSPPIA